MKALIAGFLLLLPGLVGVASEPSLTFPESKVPMPPLDLKDEAARRLGPAGDELVKQRPIIDRAAIERHLARAGIAKDNVSNMPIYRPRDDIDPKMIVHPDESIDYKMLIAPGGPKKRPQG